MKNFTNNFKQFTSRLSARWLIMALMLLVGTSTAWADVDVYVYAKNSSHYAYIWTGTSTTHNGGWPGKTFASSFTSLGNNLYKKTITGISSYNIIFNEESGKSQTSDIENISTGKCFFYEGGTTYKTEANYEMKGTYAAKFTSFDATKKAYSTSSQELDAGTYTTQVYSGSSKYWSSFDNTRGSGVTLSGGGENGYSFTLSSKGKVTFYYDPGADVAFATFESSCTPPAEPTLDPNSTTVCSGTSFDLPSGYRWYTVETGGEKLSSNTISSGVTQETVYYAEAGEDGCVSTSRTAYTVNVDRTSELTLKANPTICQGSSIVLSNYVESSEGTVKWYSNSGMTTEIDPSEARIPQSSSTYYYARATSGVCSSVDKTLTVTIKSAPSKPEVTLTPADGNIVSGNSATLSVDSPVNNVTYTLYEETRGEIETEKTSFAITEAGTYYVIGTDECGQDSPESDSKTITVCTIGSTLNSAEYDAATQKVSLEGTFEFCGKESFHGFQWKKVGSDWCDENVPTDNSDYVTLGKTTEGGTKSGEYTIEDQNSAYVFRTYVVPVGGAWIYGNEITVTPCINIATPDIDPVAICAGSAATLTLKNKQNGVTYKIDDTPIFTDGNTHTVRPEKTTTYTITATSTISCVANQTAITDVEVEVYELPDAPAIKTEDTVCPNTTFELPDLGEGKWYAQAEGGAAYGSTTINGIESTTYYYAEAVKYGCSSATRTKYTVNVHTAPVAPVITLNPATVGQDKNSVLTISNETYSPSNTKYVLYKGSSEVGEMTSQTTNVSSSDVGSVKYTVKATHKECAALTSTSNEVTLTVQEARAKIEALGDLKVDPNDPVDFVAMYVKNDGLSDFTDQGATKVTNYTWQFYNDDDKTWTDCASTNAVAGATYSIIGMTNGSDKCNNFRPNKVGKYRCKITYDAGEPNFQYSNYLDVTGDGSTAKTFKGVTMNLPVISVNTGSGKFPTCDGLSGTASKNADVIKEKISVDVKIFAKVGENIEVVYDRKARMNYRGSSSLNFVKKSYAFCTGKEKTKNDKGAVDTGKENLFGLSNGVKDKDWVLYAAAADPSIMRNRLMFDTFRDMTGGWSVNSMYVELVINGEYKGVYVLMDKITANMGDEEVEKDGRVEVEWKLDKQGNTTQEGFIVKFDKTDIVDRYENTSGDQKTFKSTYSGHDGFTTYDTQIDQRFEVEYPEKEDIEEEDLEKGQQAGDWSVVFNSIKDKFNKFEKELKDGNFSEVQKIIDYQSWADWFIITEFGKNIDGYRASNLFVYDGSKADAKIEARPLWDQELSFNNTCPNYYASYGAGSTTGFIVENSEGFNNDASTPFWFTGKYKGGRGTYNGSDQTFKGLLDDPCFVAVVKSRWETHKANALSKATLEAKLTAYTDEMGAAKDREATFWSTRSRETCQCSYGGTTGYGNNIDFATSKSTISSWIENRPAGLNTAIEGLNGLDLRISLTVTPDGGVTTPWEAVMVQVNNPSGYDYSLEYTTDPALDQVEGVIIQESNDKYTYRIPRPWEPGDGTREAIEYGIQATLKVGDAGTQCGSAIDGELTKATATITLTDEENDGCSITE